MEISKGQHICRCCNSEGQYKNLKTKYKWLGDEEIYGEMLKECFDIDVSLILLSKIGKNMFLWFPTCMLLWIESSKILFSISCLHYFFGHYDLKA